MNIIIMYVAAVAPLQNFYDATVRHLVKQGERAMQTTPTGLERCMYRMDDGGRCAAGFHIKDEHYDPSMEGRGIRDVYRSFPEVRPSFPNVQLAARLQSCHDLDSSWKDDGGLSEYGIYALKSAARDFNLSAAVLRES